MKSKKLAIMLAAVMIVMTFSGCKANKEEQKVDTSANTSSTQKAPITLKWWITNSGSKIVKSYGEIEAYKEIMKRTGVNVEFIHPANGSEQEQFNIMCASGDYPDIITYSWNAYSGGALKAVDDKVIIKLNDYMDKYAPNYKKILKDNPSIEKAVKQWDGSIVAFHDSIKGDTMLNANYGPQIRKDWLDKLGLSVPTTIDEWYNVLKAFKQNDPNGNGKADEVPFLEEKGFNLFAFSNAWGVTGGFMPTADGKIVYSKVLPAYKDFLVTMNKWYKEGLIDNEFASLARKNTDAKATDGTGGAFVGYVGSQMGSYLAVGKQKNPNYNLVAAPWPKGSAGKPYNGNSYYLSTVSTSGDAITTANKHVEETVKFLDYFYSEEGLALTNFGIKGKSYTEVDGKKQFTDEILNNPDGLDAMTAITKYATPQWGYTKQMLPEAYFPIAFKLDQQKEAAKVWSSADNSLLLPPLNFKPEEVEKNAKIMTDVSTYESELFTKIIMGVEPMTKYDEYLKTIQKMGIDEVVKNYQAAYDRRNQK